MQSHWQMSTTAICGQQLLHSSNTLGHSSSLVVPTEMLFVRRWSKAFMANSHSQQSKSEHQFTHLPWCARKQALIHTGYIVQAGHLAQLLDHFAWGMQVRLGGLTKVVYPNITHLMSQRNTHHDVIHFITKLHYCLICIVRNYLNVILHTSVCEA